MPLPSFFQRKESPPDPVAAGGPVEAARLRARRRLIGAIVLLAVGVIGFVGLIVPHLVRRIAGGRPSRLLIPSALAGADLLLAADVLVRVTPGANEVHVGVAMAALGAPFFLALLISLRRRLA